MVIIVVIIGIMNELKSFILSLNFCSIRNDSFSFVVTDFCLGNIVANSLIKSSLPSYRNPNTINHRTTALR